MKEPKNFVVVVVVALITCVITFHVAMHLSHDDLIRRDLLDAHSKVQSLQDALDNCRRHSIRPGQPIGQPAGSPLVPIPEPQPTLAR